MTFSQVNDFSGILAMAVSLVVYFAKNKSQGDFNTQAISRLEGAIKQLIEKIDKLVDQIGDTRSEIANHEARIQNLER